jgi:tetratricopeptide (TPR) repeat protein
MRHEKVVYSIRSGVFKRAVAVLLCTIVYCLAPTVSAQSATELYKTANQQYKSSQFESAAATYEKILMEGYRTPEVYYNLGNCYFKLHRTGKAILNFERAHRLAPEDEDINHNLKLAQLKTIDKVQPVPQLGIITSWNNLLASQSSKGWGLLALGFVWVALLLFAIYLLMTRKGLVLYLGTLFLILSIASVSLAFKQSMAEENSEAAILMVENVNVKSAPDANGTDLFTIHEGIKLEICDQVGGWAKVRLADGKIGWVEKNLFEKI